jgi:hypothetical protein
MLEPTPASERNVIKQPNFSQRNFKDFIAISARLPKNKTNSFDVQKRTLTVEVDLL